MKNNFWSGVGVFVMIIFTAACVPISNPLDDIIKTGTSGVGSMIAGDPCKNLEVKSAKALNDEVRAAKNSSNPMRENKKYHGQQFKVVGTITDIRGNGDQWNNATGLPSTAIRVKLDNAISCMLDGENRNIVDSLDKGQTVTACGTLDTVYGKGYELEACKISVGQ